MHGAGRAEPNRKARRSMASHKTADTPSQISQAQFEELARRLEALEAALGKRARRAGEPEYVRLEEAGAMFGLSVQGVQARLKREGRKLNGARIRRMHGTVHLADWRAFMEARLIKSPAARARAAVAAIQKGARND